MSAEGDNSPVAVRDEDVTDVQGLLRSGKFSAVSPQQYAALREVDLRKCGLNLLPPEVQYMTGVAKLNLSGNNLKSLPGEVGKWTSIQELDLGKNCLGALPLEVGQWSKIREINLEGDKLKTYIPPRNNLRSLPAEVGRWANVESLNLYSNSLESLPAEVGQWASMRTLNLWLNELQYLPAEVGKWSSVQCLDLTQNQLQSLPAEVGQWSSIRELHLSGNKLQSLPAEVKRWSRIQELDLGHNRLMSLPVEVGQWSWIEKLNLGSNRLQSLPAEVGQWSSIQKLDLVNNELKSLPVEVGQWSSIQTLDLYGNRLQSLPSEVGQWSSIQTLDLSGNKLKSLPADVGQWSSIEQLNLTQNQLQSLPVEVGQWSKIQKLDLVFNELPSLPAEVGQWSKIRDLYLGQTQRPFRVLSRLKLVDNPMRPSSLLRMSTSDVVAFYHGLSERCVRVFQQRVLLLGEKEKGKTSLVRRLTSGKPVVPGSIPRDARTFGIEISHWKQMEELTVLLDGEKKPVDIEFWDFGGQEAFFPTHQLFLNCDAVFFIVFSWVDQLTSTIEGVRQFCRMIRGYGPVDSYCRPVMFVGTHKDKFIGRDGDLMAKWERLTDALQKDEELCTLLSDEAGPQLLSVSTSDDDVERSSIPQLVEGLRLILKNQGNLGQVLYPAAYIEVEKLVDEYRSGECFPLPTNPISPTGFAPCSGFLYDRPPFVSVEEFESWFCTSTNLVRGDDVYAALRFLDLRGSVLFRPIENLVFLDPQWITREVISRSYNLGSDSGILERTVMEDAWAGLSLVCRKKIPEILCSFELAFPVGEDQSKWMVPLALPGWSDERDGIWGPEGNGSNLRRFFIRVPHAPGGFGALLMHRWFKIYPDPDSSVLRRDKLVISFPPHTPENECWAEFNVEDGLTVELRMERGAEWLASVMIEKLETLVRLRYSGLRVVVGAKRAGSILWVEREKVLPGMQKVLLGRRRFADSGEIFPLPKPSIGVRDRFPGVPGREHGYLKHVFISHAGDGNPSLAWLMYRELHRLGLFVSLDVERYVGGASALDSRGLESAISSSLSGLVIVSPSYDQESEEFVLLSRQKEDRERTMGPDRPSWLGMFVVVLLSSPAECLVDQTGNSKVLKQGRGEPVQALASRAARIFLDWLCAKWAGVSGTRHSDRSVGPRELKPFPGLVDALDGLNSAVFRSLVDRMREHLSRTLYYDLIRSKQSDAARELANWGDRLADHKRCLAAALRELKADEAFVGSIW